MRSDWDGVPQQGMVACLFSFFFSQWKISSFLSGRYLLFSVEDTRLSTNSVRKVWPSYHLRVADTHLHVVDDDAVASRAKWWIAAIVVNDVCQIVVLSVVMRVNSVRVWTRTSSHGDVSGRPSSELSLRNLNKSEVHLYVAI